MIIKALYLKNFRNYRELAFLPSDGINILYGDNAQGKTNLLEALYVGSTTKSHKGSKDRELISFDADESHIRLDVLKKDVPYRIDMHLKKNKPKGIALNAVPLRRASDLFGISNVIFFSPEDLGIIKNGPSERRRFLDMELCQLSRVYTYDLISYNRIVNQKNNLLKNYIDNTQNRDMLEIINEQLVKYGSSVIRERSKFAEEIDLIIREIHSSITSQKEEIKLSYQQNVSIEDFESELKKNIDREIKQSVCLIGPHRDDLCFMINNRDIRHFGSQGQQRTAALSLKLSEIRLVERILSEKPILLLDDVLSELDRNRQNMLLSSINGIQTFISCTGLDDFVDNRIKIDRVFHISNGAIIGEN